jgi:hypothetical protein
MRSSGSSPRRRSTRSFDSRGEPPPGPRGGVSFRAWRLGQPLARPCDTRGVAKRPKRPRDPKQVATMIGVFSRMVDGLAA